MIQDCRALGKQWAWVKPGLTTPRHIAEFIRESRVTVSMLAGDREGQRPTNGARAERFPITAFSSPGGGSQRV
jgi:hypothetical protein